MENKQTSVEWLIEQLTPAVTLPQKYIDEIKEQAQVMHKEEIVDAWEEGWNDSMQGIHRNATYGKGYYNETYNK